MFYLWVQDSLFCVVAVFGIYYYWGEEDDAEYCQVKRREVNIQTRLLTVSASGPRCNTGDIQQMMVICADTVVISKWRISPGLPGFTRSLRPLRKVTSCLLWKVNRWKMSPIFPETFDCNIHIIRGLWSLLIHTLGAWLCTAATVEVSICLIVNLMTDD